MLWVFLFECVSPYIGIKQLFSFSQTLESQKKTLGKNTFSLMCLFDISENIISL